MRYDTNKLYKQISESVKTTLQEELFNVKSFKKRFDKEVYAINVMYCPKSTFKAIVNLFNEEVLDYKVNNTNVTFYVNNIYHVNEIVEQLDKENVLNSNNMSTSENKITIYKISSSRINDNLNVNENAEVDNYNGEYVCEITYNKNDDMEGLGEMGRARLYTKMLRRAGLDVTYKQKRYCIDAIVKYTNKREFDDVVRFAAFDLGYTDLIMPKLPKKTYDEVSAIVLNGGGHSIF